MTVPAEYIGRARDLWRRLKTERAEMRRACEAVLRPVAAREAHGKLPWPLMHQAAITWRESAPWFGRLDFALHRVPGGIDVEELRITSSVFSHTAWGEGCGEGIAVRRFTVALRRTGTTLTLRTIAHVGLHALGRRMQRASSDDRSVLADIAALAGVQADFGEFLCRCPSGGGWLGEVAVDMDDDRAPVLWCRTFIEADAPQMVDFVIPRA